MGSRPATTPQPTSNWPHQPRLFALVKIYYRQNMYVLAAQDLDGEDMLRYLVPSVIFTGISAFLGFCGSSAMVRWFARANRLIWWR